MKSIYELPPVDPQTSLSMRDYRIKPGASLIPAIDEACDVARILRQPVVLQIDGVDVIVRPGMDIGDVCLSFETNRAAGWVLQ